MQWLTPTITQHFQLRQIWGLGSHAWTSGAPASGIIIGENSSVDSPVTSGNPYTVAWYAYFRVNTRAYTKEDENINDENIYIEIKIATLHNKLWTSNASEQDGFVDIGVLSWDSNRKPPAETIVSQEYIHNQSAAKTQLYDWAGISDSNVICGVIADNGYKTGQTVPNGAWGTHLGGIDTPVAERTFTMVFDASYFNDDGTLKEQYRMMPFNYALRSHPGSGTVRMTLDRTIDVDLSVDPFIYIPWAIMKNGQWVSCNRRPDGLMVYKNGSFSKAVRNSILARVRNGKLPSNANGFRMKNNKWQVSPITPDSD